MIDFDAAIDRVLGNEAGYVNDPRDPGGETKWGICKRDHPDVDIPNLTRDGAKEIYLEQFWKPLTAQVQAPGAEMYQYCDAAVNHGIPNAIRMVQTAVGVVPDGHFGPVSQAALSATPVCDALLLFLAARLEFMSGLVKWDAFGRGWARRIVKNLRYAAEDV